MRLVRKSPLWLALGALSLMMCSAPPPLDVDQQRQIGDRQREWGLIYYVSWEKEQERNYLRLSRRYMAAAAKSYYDIQVRIGHSYPVFYELDRKRLQSCAFLRRIAREAAKHRIDVNGDRAAGCLL
jgi:hypothetical protein